LQIPRFQNSKISQSGTAFVSLCFLTTLPSLRNADLAEYFKKIRNFSDEEQLLSTGIVFPISVAGADIRGTEVRLDWRDVRGFTSFVSYANARATITTPITGGLFLNDEDGQEKLFGRGRSLCG
jgi:hypothetical protein